MADLDAMLKASPDTYEDTAFVRMTGFGDSSINLMVSAYLRTADLGVFLRMQNDLNLNIMDVMKADGVDFAFPSTTVYLAKENGQQKSRCSCIGFFTTAQYQRHHEGEPQHHADDARRFVLLHGFRYHLLSRHADHAPGGGAHGATNRATLTQPARASASSAAGGSTRPDAAPAQKVRLPCPACASGRLTSAFRGYSASRCPVQGPAPADGLRLTLQNPARAMIPPPGALGQIVESHGQHHPAHPAMLFLESVCISRPAAYFQPQQAHSTQHQTRRREWPDQQCRPPPARWQAAAGSTLAASMMPPPCRRASAGCGARPARRTRKTPAAPSAVIERRQRRMTRCKQIDVHIAFPLPTDVYAGKGECEEKKLSSFR